MAKRWSEDSTWVLLNEVKKNYETLRAKLSITVTNLTKRKIWQEITDTINRDSPRKWEVEQVKKKWENLQSTCPIKIRQYLKAQGARDNKIMPTIDPVRQFYLDHFFKENDPQPDGLYPLEASNIPLENGVSCSTKIVTTISESATSNDETEVLELPPPSKVPRLILALSPVIPSCSSKSDSLDKKQLLEDQIKSAQVNLACKALELSAQVFRSAAASLDEYAKLSLEAAGLNAEAARLNVKTAKTNDSTATLNSFLAKEKTQLFLTQNQNVAHYEFLRHMLKE